jgi:sporulation protein YlmC with PRC-barrel domain
MEEIETYKLKYMIQMNKTYDHDNSTGMNCEGPDANTPVSRLTAISIIGDEVNSVKGEKLGQIKDLMINIHSGIVEYAVIERGGILGIGSRLFAVPFDQLYLDPARKLFKIEKSESYFSDSPGFDKLHWPDTNLHQQKHTDVHHESQMLSPL